MSYHTLMKSFSTRVAELTEWAFSDLISANGSMRFGDELARRKGMSPDDARETFEAIYFDEDEDASLNAMVYGCYSDAYGDEHSAELGLDNLLNLLTRELGPLRPLGAQ